MREEAEIKGFPSLGADYAQGDGDLFFVCGNISIIRIVIGVWLWFCYFGEREYDFATLSGREYDFAILEKSLSCDKWAGFNCYQIRLIVFGMAVSFTPAPGEKVISRLAWPPRNAYIVKPAAFTASDGDAPAF